MTKKIFFLAAFLVAAGSLAALARSDANEMDITPEPKTVKTMTVTPLPFQPTARYSGFVRGENETNVSAKTAGYIVKLVKEEGDAVKAGETIAILDGRELSAAETAAVQSLESLKTSLRDTKRYYEQKIDEAKSSLDKVKADQDAGNATNEDVEVAEEVVESVKRLRDAEISRLRANIASAEGSLLISQAGAENIAVPAPFTGIITKRMLSVGSFVSPGVPIYSIASASKFEVAFSVPSTTARAITKGDTLPVFTKADDKPVSGTVFSVSPATDWSMGQSTIRVRFDADAAGTLHLGDYVEAAITTREKREAILIPESAIRYEYDDPFVFVVEDGIAKKVSLRLGASGRATREVLSGLTPGMVIVTEGQYTLRDHESVNVYAGT